MKKLSGIESRRGQLKKVELREVKLSRPYEVQVVIVLPMKFKCCDSVFRCRDPMSKIHYSPRPHELVVVITKGKYLSPGQIGNSPN